MSEFKKSAYTKRELKTGHLWKKDGKNIPFKKAANYSGTIVPKFLVIHYTAGSSASGAINWFRRKASKASAHFIVDLDGSVTQMVPTNKKAWHAGRSSWKGYKGLNSHSIGIEVVNPGALDIIDPGYSYKTFWNKIISADEADIVEETHVNGGKKKGWQLFTQEQIMTILDLGSALMEEYDLQEAVGHDMISPKRKTDPGPCMSRRIYDFLNGRASDDSNEQ